MKLSSVRKFVAVLPFVAIPSIGHDARIPERVSAARPAVEGYVVAMTVKMEDPGAPTLSGPVNMTLKVAGERVRVEMDMSAMMGGGGDPAAMAMLAGAFMLLRDSGKVAMIMPNMQNPMSGGTGMGMIMDMSAIAGSAGVVMPAITDMKMNVDDLGAGETVLGHPTRKYRIRQTYSLDGKAHEGTSEALFATDLGAAEKGFRKFNESFGGQFLGSSTAKGVNEALMAKMPAGFPLRMTSVMQTPTGRITVTMETSKAEKVTFDEKEFEVPANIQLMDMAGMGRGRGGE
jgi:hypothetical protein